LKILSVLMMAVLLFPGAACTGPSIRVIEDPLGPEDHLALGAAYEQRGEWDLAIGQYELARRGKHRARAELCLGNAWFGKGKYDTAEQHYRVALDLEPECAEALNNLAWLMLERGGDLEEAENLSRQAVDLAMKAGDAVATATYRDTLEKIMNRRTQPESGSGK